MEKEMYPFVKAALRRRFPASEGWEITFNAKKDSYEPDFFVTDTAKKRRIVVEAKYVCEISERHVNQVNDYVASQKGKSPKIEQKMLVLPSGSNTTKVPDDFTVIYLKKFPCNG